MSAMVFDSIANGSIPAPASNSNEFAKKKKKANRSAKLKQCKLDARRDQWLSQVKKNAVNKEESNNAGVVNASPRNVREQENLGISSLQDENTRSNNYSDIESPSNSHTSGQMGGSDSGTQFTGSSTSNTSSSSRSSGGSSSDEECLDDWEAIADALAAAEHKEVNCNPNVQQSQDPGNISKHRTNNNPAKLDQSANTRAWRSDDTFRPQSLPNLSKQRTFPMNSDRYYGRGGTVWQRKTVIVHPASCPICCEELDLTDSSFLPCPCGFRLCLFCHKRILEGDGRCPGCRKPYSLDGYGTKF